MGNRENSLLRKVFSADHPLSVDWAKRDSESLLWLASYPRSGNTFTRILLANYFAAGRDEYDINKLLDFIPADTSELLWADFPPMTPCSTEDVWRARASVFDHYRRTGKASAFFGLKTHSANVRVSGISGFGFRPNDRVIYVVRHPLDVLLSNCDYNGRDLDQAIELMCTRGLSLNYPRYGALEVRGSWAEHVSSWLFTPPCPILLVRYEELCLQTEQTLESIISFLGAPIKPDRLKRAVEAARFDRLRQQESAHSFIERPETTASGTFFRKGTPLQWLKELTPQQAYRLADGCGEVMRRMGYTDPRSVFFDGRNAISPVNLDSLDPSTPLK